MPANNADYFVPALDKSRDVANRLALSARSRGFQLLIKPSETAPNFDDRYKYTDAGDLALIGRVEVKQRPDLQFTSRTDYPYRTVIVDEAYKIDDQSADQVLQYIIMNGAETHAAVVYGWTRKYWKAETHFDKRAKRDATFLCCPLNVVRFCRVDDIFWSNPEQDPKP